jgi:putative membrane protein
MLRLLLVWLVNALALLALPYVFPWVEVDSLQAAVIAAGARPHQHADPVALILLTLPATLLTLKPSPSSTASVRWVGSFVDGFHVSGFWSAFFGAIVYSLISWLLASLLPRKQG